MFSKPRNNVIESDEGFYIEVLGRTGIKYVEGMKATFIDSEVLMGPHGMGVHKDSVKNWQVPRGNIDDEKKARIIKDARKVSLIKDIFLFEGFELEEPIDDNEKEQIVENVRRAFLFEGFEIVIV